MKEKKAVIITIYDPNPNMGNRLQNYAVQTVVEKLGFEVTTVAFRKPTMNWKKKIKLYLNKLSGYHFTKNKLFWKYVPRQIEIFDKFNQRYIKTTRINSLEKIPKSDFYVLGSDQLWNPEWWNQENPEMEKNIYFATFANPEQIVCFSPSFGRDFIPEEWRDWFEKQLSRIVNYSIREEAGKKIIKELTGKNAEVTVDPTLMLSQEEWNKIATKPEKLNNNTKYILTYFLGGRSERIDNDIKKYAKQINATVIYLFDQSYPDMFWASPSDFIYLVAHAELILTDSFHACVFSFIYDKPFLVYNRIGATGMMSRMNTLFEKFDLKRKYVDGGLKNDILECDYSKGKEMLKKEQQFLINFLKLSFGI